MIPKKIVPRFFLCAYIKSCFCPVSHLKFVKNSIWLNKLFVNIFLTTKARDTIQTVLKSA